MKNKTSHNVEWEIISKYLSGEMSEDERLAFEKLISSDPEYARIVAASDKDMYLVDEVNQIRDRFDTDSAWSNVKTRIIKTPVEKTASYVSTFQLGNWRKFVQVAAMLIITIGIGLASYEIFTNNSGSYQNFTTQLNESGKSIVLEDGSKVTLNGQSKLIYPKSFKGNERKVELLGEAFFDIAKNPAKPFIISVKDAQIKVLGTSFNVNAANNHVEVLVETGKVQFSIAKDPSRNIILEKGDFGILQENELEKTILRDENYLSWKTQQLIFKNMELKSVARVIDRTYQVEIQFEDSTIMNLKINTTFTHEPLGVVLENLCRPFNLAYVKEGNKILIKKELE